MHTKPPKMYVLVRLDLSEKYQCVQGAHALSAFSFEHSDLFNIWGNSSLIFLGVRNLKNLRFWIEKLREEQKTFSTFKEPDLDNQETAVACYDVGTMFKDLKTA